MLGSEIGVYLAVDLPRPTVVYEGTGEVFAESWEKPVWQHAVLVRARAVLPACFWSSTSPEALVG